MNKAKSNFQLYQEKVDKTSPKMVIMGGRKVKLQNATQIKWAAGANISNRSSSRQNEKSIISTAREPPNRSLRKITKQGGHMITNVVSQNQTMVLDTSMQKK